MATGLIRRGAHRKGAPFLFLGWLLAAGSLLAAPCDSVVIDEQVRVKRVYDGDTVRLVDGRKVRFAGINTPELGRDDHPAEPLAEAARDRLRALIDEADGRLGLHIARDPHDRYGRLLAYPFLPDGRNINAILLDEGLAAALVVPPNRAYRDCHFAREGVARERQRGIWQTRRFRPWPSEALPGSARGFYLVAGTVVRLGESKRSIWLTLEGDVALRIARRRAGEFTTLLDGIVGKRIEVRGWLYSRKGGLTMSLADPAMVKRLKE